MEATRGQSPRFAEGYHHDICPTEDFHIHHSLFLPTLPIHSLLVLLGRLLELQGPLDRCLPVLPGRSLHVLLPGRSPHVLRVL